MRATGSSSSSSSPAPFPNARDQFLLAAPFPVRASRCDQVIQFLLVVGALPNTRDQPLHHFPLGPRRAQDFLSFSQLAFIFVLLGMRRQPQSTAPNNGLKDLKLTTLNLPFSLKVSS